ncbi:hypothetical protein COLO4_19263 [Corchorus olitorius]|uniref:Uncharacterized protein n=1 Tax=Corchorus olitorius TaxID=93759 RepID=A0A1R3J644_9ROSI|nr:hypothetical protein COLO4_19263 [Corchorus olitorius]
MAMVLLLLLPSPVTTGLDQLESQFSEFLQT